MKTPVEQLLDSLETVQQMYKKTNQMLALSILEPTVKLTKELLVAERIMIGENYHKGIAEGKIAGKIEAQAKVV